MAGSRQLSDIRTRVRQRGDFQNAEHKSDTEVDQAIQSVYEELQERLLASGHSYNENQTTLTGDGTTEDHTLPTDYLGIIAVDILLDSGVRWSEIEPYEIWDRNKYRTNSYFRNRGYGWRVVGSNTGAVLRIMPALESGEQVRVFYTQTTPDLDSDTDIYMSWNGWEEYLIVGAVIKLLMKENSVEQARLFQAEMGDLRERIDTMAQVQKRQSSKVVDVETRQLMGWDNTWDE